MYHKFEILTWEVLANWSYYYRYMELSEIAHGRHLLELPLLKEWEINKFLILKDCY